MKTVSIEIPSKTKREIFKHLLPPDQEVEEAGFAYVSPNGGDNVFRLVEWMPVLPKGFEIQSAYHIELTDETQAKVIKRAHDLGASMVELHSHLGLEPPRFSASDRYGFEEFVPHVWWRLQHKPYFAIVVGKAGWDGFAWMSDPKSPERLGGLVTDDGVLRPTALSPLELSAYRRWGPSSLGSDATQSSRRSDHHE